MKPLAKKLIIKQKSLFPHLNSLVSLTTFNTTNFPLKGVKLGLQAVTQSHIFICDQQQPVLNCEGIMIECIMIEFFYV